MNMNNVKYIVIGAIVGLSIGNASVIASEVGKLLNVVKVDYDIVVDGEPLVSDKPTLNLNGTTYLPLRDISIAMKKDINWNSKLSRVEIGEVKVVDKISLNNNNTYPFDTYVMNDDIYFKPNDVCKSLNIWFNLDNGVLSFYKSSLAFHNKEIPLYDILEKDCIESMGRIYIPISFYKDTLIRFKN